MKIAIVTLAGVSNRFNEGMLECEHILKGIYTTGGYRQTLLYSILKKCEGIDKVVIVGGYQYQKLVEYIDICRNDFLFQIELVFNPEYKKYGTGYTLKLGLEKCVAEENCTEIILIEGDLYFDAESFQEVVCSTKNVATYNLKSIDARKAVIAYVNEEYKLNYVYSTEHNAIIISEKIWEIYNSGQIWKFVNMECIKQLLVENTLDLWCSTNLKFIEQYFSKVSRNEREMLVLKDWENCNTREDYENCMHLL